MTIKIGRWQGVAVGLVVVAGVGIGAYRLTHPAATDGLTLYGNVDIRQVDLAFNAAGRLQELRKEEGDTVKAGEVLARIEPETYQDLMSLATARVAAQQATVDKLLAGSRAEEIARDRAEVESDRAAVADAESLFNRNKELVKGGAVSRQLYDDAKNALDGARARLQAAERTAALTVEGPRQEDIDQAKAQLRADQATLDLARRRLEDTELKAPADGVVLSRIVEVGAMMSPTNPVYTVALTDKVWVRTYIPETDLGRVKWGMTVKVSSDTDPGHLYDGWVGFISPTAEFTPKTVETPELRTQLIYRLRVFIRDPDDRLRQGMPVTVRVPLGG